MFLQFLLKPMGYDAHYRRSVRLILAVHALEAVEGPSLAVGTNAVIAYHFFSCGFGWIDDLTNR